MMSRGRLEYTGFAMPADWAAPNLAALPIAQELLVVPDLQKDHRYACLGSPPCVTCLSHCPGQWQHCSRQEVGTSGGTSGSTSGDVGRYSWLRLTVGSFRRFSEGSSMAPARFYVAAPLTSSTGMQIGAL